MQVDNISFVKQTIKTEFDEIEKRLATVQQVMKSNLYDEKKNPDGVLTKSWNQYQFYLKTER